jgi:hypothetical protein
MGKCLFENELFSQDDLSDLGIYTKWLERATGFIYEPEAALLDVEDDFYAIDYLRGWIGEAALSAHLRETMGEDWFTRREAGMFLVKLWREGERWSLDELLSASGIESLDLSPLESAFHRLGAPPGDLMES